MYYPQNSLPYAKIPSENEEKTTKVRGPKLAHLQGRLYPNVIFNSASKIQIILNPILNLVGISHQKISLQGIIHRK